MSEGKIKSVQQSSWGARSEYTIGGNTNVVSSPPEIKVSPSLVQLNEFTHLASKSPKTEVRQQWPSFPRSMGSRGKGILVVSYGNLPGVTF